MIDQSIIDKIIELRVQGLSYEKISKRVKISKPTIMDVIK